MSEELPSGQRIEYEYLPHTNVLTKKRLLVNEVVLSEETFTYDEDLALIQTTTRAGSQSQNVYYTLNKSHPAYNFPKTLIETTYDHETGVERQIKREERTYNLACQVLQTDVYDANDAYCYTLSPDIS